MKFSIRDLFLVTLVVAVCVAWWVDRSNSRRELQRVKIKLALEEDSHKRLRFITDIQEERIQADREAKEELKRALSDLAAKHAPMPDSSAPAPNTPEP